jgi:cobalt/nickel transport system permease protein
MTTDVVAMHMSDGIVNAPVSLAFGVVALVGLAVCVARARRDLDDRTAPLAGLVAAFVFAVQMLNFPVLPGVSGHLLGGALTAILVGPYVGALCVAIVLVLQALLFADGGLSALGTNITNMALIGVAAGYTTALLTYRLARRVRGAVPVPLLGGVAFVAALVGTVCAAMGFVVEYALGGAASTSLGTVAGYMFGTHVLIGIGEGVITALTVMAVARSRPDLVHLLRVHPARDAVAA